MRRLRSFLPTEVYFVTIRTVEERFALSPYACPGAWECVEGAHLDCDERRAMADRGRVCVAQTEVLTDEIAQAERDEKHARPGVAHSTFTDSIPNIIGSWLARGVKKFGIHLYGVVWMGNHAHLLLKAPQDNLAEFMGYLNGHVAANVNRFLRRQNQLWSRRYAAAQVLDDAAALERLAYLLANPQNAGIEDSIGDWPGLSSATFLRENREQRFLCFDRTAWHKNGRPNDIAPFLSTVKLEHKLLPQLAMLDKRELWAKLRELIQPKLRSVTSSSMRGNDPVHSLRRRLQARAVIPTDRPALPKRSPQPLCHTTKPSLYKLYREWYQRFRLAYKASSHEYMQGNTNVEFPPGAFAPSRYPRARRLTDGCYGGLLYPTRKNLELADAHGSYAT
jgi:REP element-mobilizing transposase RayT